MGKTFKFPFLNKGEFEIGPCFTLPKFRGRGVYPSVLIYILEKNKNSKFYMIVHKNNIPSIRGIEKSGFVFEKLIGKTKFLKVYKEKRYD